MADPIPQTAAVAALMACGESTGYLRGLKQAREFALHHHVGVIAFDMALNTEIDVARGATEQARAAAMQHVYRLENPGAMLAHRVVRTVRAARAAARAAWRGHK